MTALLIAAGQLSLPQQATTTIRTGESSVVKAVVNQPSTTQIAGDLVLPAIPAPSFQPFISTGGESVVKAEIDASHTVHAAGDFVHHKEEHRTHHETHVYQRESAVGAVGKIFNQAFYPDKEEEESIRRECQGASHSDDTLFAFVIKQISAIESVGFMQAAAKGQLTQARYSASMYALEIIGQRNGERREVLNRVDRLRDKLSALVSSQKQQPLLMFGGGILIMFLLLFLACGMAYFGLRHDSSVKQDVQKLIQEGKYEEARIRAQSLSSERSVEQMMKVIDKAEKSHSLPSRTPASGPPSSKQDGFSRKGVSSLCFIIAARPAVPAVGGE